MCGVANDLEYHNLFFLFLKEFLKIMHVLDVK